MARFSLDLIEVPRPCPADWNAMRGDDKSRFCDHCSQHVYNLSAMTREAAEALIEEKEGKLCGRFYRREDGTVVTVDCGGGWKLRAKKLGTLVGVACAAVLTGICSPYVYSRNAIQTGQAMDNAPPARLFEKVIERLQCKPTRITPMVAGGISFVAPPPTPPTQTSTSNNGQ